MSVATFTITVRDSATGEIKESFRERLSLADAFEKFDGFCREAPAGSEISLTRYLRRSHKWETICETIKE